MEIDILPLDGAEKVSKELLKKLQAELKKKDVKTRVLKAAKMPKGAWDEGRGQYDAHKALELSGKKGVLAITSADIFEPGMNFVFGTGFREGSAIVSYARLKPEWYGEKASQKKIMERLAKEALHEIGHTLGLKPCNNRVGKKICAMTFSSTVHDIDAKAAAFCTKDAKMLE